MAKKKTKKAKKKEIELNDNGTVKMPILPIREIREKPVCVGMSNFDLEKRIVALEQRIGRLVDAISKSKRTKGL